MNPPPENLASLLGASKRLLGRMPALVERRVELLMVEVQEEREQLLRAILLTLGLATFGLLAGITLTVGILLLCWCKRRMKSAAGGARKVRHRPGKGTSSGWPGPGRVATS